MTQELSQGEDGAPEFGSVAGEALAAPESAPEEPCRGVFSRHYQIEQVSDARGVARFIVSDAESNSSWGMGAAELKVAQLFDGVRTHGEIADLLLSDHRINISAEKLKAFEARLIKLRILRVDSADSRPLDPLTSINFGPLHPLLVINLLRIRPEPTLTHFASRRPWLVGRLVFWAAVSISLVFVGTLLSDWQRIYATAASTYSGWWWVWLYLIVCSSGIFHEGGHMLACKAFKVRIHEVGLMIYFLLPFAWTTPNQKDWGRLKSRERIVTTLAGPLGSLVFGGLGAMLWSLSPAESVGQRLGVTAMIAGTYGAALTMIPFLNGDGYVLLTELFGLPNLRSNSFNYLRALLSKKGESRHVAVNRRRRMLYLFVALGTLTGWLALGILALTAVILIVRQ